MFKRGTLTRGAPLSAVIRDYSKPSIWCFANTRYGYFWHVPTTTNQFFDTLTTQVSSWIAARLAVLVEFAVFLISSTISNRQVDIVSTCLFISSPYRGESNSVQGAGVKQTRSVCSPRARAAAAGRSRCSKYADSSRKASAQYRCDVYRISAGLAQHQRIPRTAENRTLCRARA